MNVVPILAGIVFVIIFILIGIEVIHRTYAALLGAFIFVFIGAITPEDILHFIDLEILAVVFGLFLLVRGAERSGLFQLLAVQIMRASGSPIAFAVILMTFAFILALFVSNIGAMLIMASITITMARSLKIKPQTLLIFQSFVINIGGMVLWMGSIPNIIVGLEAGLSFMDFLVNVMPLGVLLYLVTLVVFIRMFKADYTPEPEEEFRDLEFGEWIERAIEVSGLHASRVNTGMITAAIIMILTILGFAVYESFNMTPAFVALFCGFFMMLSQTRDPSVIMREIDLSTILFLAGMFIMINGLGKVGIIEALSQSLFAVLGSSPIRASVILMWLSGVISSVVDNIPVATSLSPIVRDMVVDKSWEILWWGLVIGANLGGCMTPIGSPSNVIAMGVSEQEGYPIPFNQFLKLGVMLTVIYFIISMIYIYVRYGLLVT